MPVVPPPKPVALPLEYFAPESAKVVEGNWRRVHEHFLQPQINSSGSLGFWRCDGCGEEIKDGNCYGCFLCSSIFHEGCAELALETKLFLHPCPLFLHTSTCFRCDSCSRILQNVFAYRCVQCEFHRCLECTARAAICVRERQKEQVLHCCHHHPLQPLPAEPDFLLPCQICNVPCSLGPTWGCKPCKFYLHKPCLDLLPEMVQTNLGSRIASWVLNTVGETCMDCRKHMGPRLVFLRAGKKRVEYLCVSCCLIRKMIDESSFKVPKVINHFFHPCPDLRLIFSPLSSTCNACFLSPSHFSYHCDSCDFFLCPDCAQLSQLASHENEAIQLVQHFCHWHPLKLFSGSQDTDQICNLCERLCSEPYYSCIKLCHFSVHKSCMDSLTHKTRHLLLEPTVVLRHVPSFKCTTCNRHISGLTYYCKERKCKFCVKCVLWPENVLGDDGRFKSVLHWHQLSLCEIRIEEKGRRCFLCKEFCLAWSLCYKCSECDLFFHKSCAELPMELDHPIHPRHRLTLTYRSSPNQNAIMTCNLCLRNLSGSFPLIEWIYQCGYCHFQLDTQCASSCLPSLEYKGHNHRLCVVVNMHGNRNCQACGRSCKGFCTVRCVDKKCEFDLHLQCGPLPVMLKHVCHVHSLILKDYYVEDNGPDEFACHVCEEERDPRLRVYCCSQGCLMICDIKCLLYEVLSLLRGKQGELELTTPFPQVPCRVICNKPHFVDTMSHYTFEGARGGNRKIEQVFSMKDFVDSLPGFGLKEKQTFEEENKPNDEEVNNYSFSWKALSRFAELLRTPSVVHLDTDFARRYQGSIVTGEYELPEILAPLYEEFFGMYNIIGHGYNLSYSEKRAMIFITCCVLHEMRITKVVDVTKDIILVWLGLMRYVQDKGRFNVGFVAENIKQVWQAHYYIQSKKIVDEKTSRLEREMEQVSMYKAELRTKMDELLIKMDEAEARHQKLQISAKEHETYRVVGSRGPMKKVRNDALDIKWRTCYESLITYPENAPTK